VYDYACAPDGDADYELKEEAIAGFVVFDGEVVAAPEDRGD